MKMRKLITVIGVSVMSLSLLTGCVKSVEMQSGEDAKKSEQTEKQSEDKDTKKDKKDNKDIKDKKDDKDWTTLGQESFEECTLISSENDQVVMLNADGSVKKVVELTGDLEANEDKNDFIADVSGNKIIYCRTSDSEDKNRQNVYLYDIDEEKWTLLDNIESFSYIDCIDGAVYVEATEYGVNNGKNEYVTTKYTVNKQGEVSKEEVFKEINMARSENDLYTQTNYYGNATNFTTAYCLNKFGFAVYVCDNKIWFYDENGKEVNSYELAASHHPEIKAVSKDVIAIEELDENYELCGIYTLDVKTMKYEPVNYDDSLYSDKNQPTVIGMADGIIYLVERVSYYNPETATVTGYDIDTGNTYSVVKEDTKPGHTYLTSPIMYSFYAIGNKVYYLAESEDATEWYCLTKDGETWEKEPLNVVAKEYSYTKYATIEKFSYSANCPYCDALCCVDYYEWPVIKSSVKNADKINETIEAMVKNYKDTAENYTPSFSETDCKDFLHNGIGMGYDSDDCRVYNVSTILDHYLFIERKGYQNFAGAAHGMPYEDNMIFDLNTGDEVNSLRDMMDISETELKEVVAEKAAEDFWASYEGKYFATTKEELYDQVYAEISFDFGYVTFFDDYLTFDFQPYDLGPYASGTISVPILYRSLQMK